MSKLDEINKKIVDTLKGSTTTGLFNIYDFHMEYAALAMAEIKQRIINMQDAAEDAWYERNTRD